MNKLRTRLVTSSLIIGICLLLPSASQAADSGRVDAVADGFFTGESFNDRLGTSVATAGDVNGDGYDDFLIGARLFSGSAGAAYLVLGRATPWSLGTPINQVPTIRYTGQVAGDQAGTSVAGAGDVNGDGFDDILVGSPLNSGTGAVYLILGSAVPTTASLSTAIKFTGQAAGDQAGTSVAGAGDVNGDGFDDILVGSQFNDAPNNDSGAAYLVLGSGTPTGGVLGAIKYSGVLVDDHAGRSVAGLGDVNGDGLGDILIAAPDEGALNEGAVYLMLGSASPASSSLSTAIQYDGESTFQRAGQTLAGPGDVNGDGLADMFVGTNETNRFFLILGQTTGLSGGFLSLSAIGYTLPDSGEASVGGAGDVNGDGFADMLVGASNAADGPIPNTGAAYLVMGSGKPQPSDIDSAVKYIGAATIDFLGQAVAGAGDVNGDGLADLILGAPQADNSGTTEVGAAYLVLSDTLHSETLSYRQRQRLIGSGNARPVLFDQSRVRLDFTLAAFSSNDIQVNRYLYHPCSTGLRLAMPIWDVGSGKVGITSQMDLRFQYTNNQIAGMTEGNLVLWTRPSGQPCANWVMVPGSVVDTAHNFVSISGLTNLGQFTVADSPPSPTALEGIETAVHTGGDFPLVNLVLMFLIPASGTTYWYLRSRRETGL